MAAAVQEVEGCQHWVPDDYQEEYIRHWVTTAAANGFLVAPPDQQGVGRAARFGVAPCTLLPTAVPKAAFTQGSSLQQTSNVVMSRVARDTAFLQEHLATAGKGDEFTGQLLRVMQQVMEEQPDKYTHHPVFGLLRTDYMLHCPPGTPREQSRLLQVETNTIASSFGMLSSRVRRLHRQALERLVVTHKHRLAPRGVTQQLLDERLPDDKPFEELAPEAFRAAHDLYLSRAGGKPRVVPDTDDVVLLMVVLPGEYNAFDQHHLSEALWTRHRLRTVRASLEELHRNGRLSDDGTLLYTPQGGGSGADGGNADVTVEASIVYFRAGYAPTHYPTQDHWDARLMLERSQAILCPNAALHLAGTKKIQQVLADRTVLARFLDDEAEADRLSATFAGLYSLDADDVEGGQQTVDEVIQRARDAPNLFVLKPQREGGGYNLFDDHLVDGLNTLSAEALKSHILMDRILPPPLKAAILRSNPEFDRVDVDSEFGFYGAFLTSGGEGQQDLALNSPLGFLMRTKPVTSTEAGVAAGFGVLDSPFLTL